MNMNYMLIRIFLSLFAVLIGWMVVLGAENDTINYRKKQNDIYKQEVNQYLNHLDSFVINAYYKKVIELNAIEHSADSQIYTPPADRDSLYAGRLKELDKNTPFDLCYNSYTGAFIDLYVFKKRPLTEYFLGLSEYYFPVFEEILDKYDLPVEFKYLAVVESALNVKARSRAGAAGLWQFMYRTGKQYGLEETSYIDERYELYAATDAACRFFRDLYRVYGNWELVIAAYNCGPGNVNKAIRRSGGKKNYWEIREYLPKETRSYVPAFIAVNYAMNYNEEHGLRPVFPDSLNLITDTLKLKGPFDLMNLSEYFCANLDQLLYLNPSLKLGKLPDDGKIYTLRLPIALMNAYIHNESEFNEHAVAINELIEQAEIIPITRTIVATTASQSGTYTVKRGDVLGTIAEKNNCSVSQLITWNNLNSSRIYEGQKLRINSQYNINSQTETVTKKEVKPKEMNIDYKYHIIKPGDTLWDIAKMYEGVTVSDLKKLNQGLNHNKLKPGDKIIVSGKS